MMHLITQKLGAINTRPSVWKKMPHGHCRGQGSFSLHYIVEVVLAERETEFLLVNKGQWFQYTWQTIDVNMYVHTI